MKKIMTLFVLFRDLGKTRFLLVLAAVFGILGHFMAFFIPVLGLVGVLYGKPVLLWIVLCALFRGLCRYLEQALNHDVAFRVLASIRHQVFVALRKLVPGQFEQYGYGNLMSAITGDIEALEVFYAHTISPILIALVFNGTISVWLFRQDWRIGLIGLGAYLLVGLVIPLIASRKGAVDGNRVRHGAARLNEMTLDAVFGFIDIIQFKHWDIRRKGLISQQNKLNAIQKRLNRVNEGSRWLTDSIILLSFVFVLSFGDALLAAVVLVSSFGPVVALSNLSANMHHTMTAAQRIDHLVRSEPSFVPVVSGEDVDFTALNLVDCTLGYGDSVVLDKVNLTLKSKGIIGVRGASGVGKTTLFKAIMQLGGKLGGQILWSNKPLETINTKQLRAQIGYMEQETTIFQDTVFNNVRIGDWEASEEAVVAACKRANIHDFIMTLPLGYQTMVGPSLSSGEKQRIGLARLFLHDAKLWLLDEPTANLDALNEAQIMQEISSLRDEKSILVSSHRHSTLATADEIVVLKS